MQCVVCGESVEESENQGDENSPLCDDCADVIEDAVDEFDRD